MELNIAVCDDSEADRRYLTGLTEAWAAGAGHTVRLSSFVSAENFLFLYGEKSGYDILLLDIELGGMDGVAMAKRLRQKNDGVQIIFITGYSDYIAEGYEVEALHFLLKPVKREKLFAVLDRAAEKAAKNEKVLCLEAGRETVRIPVYQVRYAEVFGNYVTIHASQEYTVKRTLSELETQLDNRFYRVGRSVIVNLTKIARVSRQDIRLVDGTSIPLPRGAYEGVNQAIIQMR